MKDQNAFGRNEGGYISRESWNLRRPPKISSWQWLGLAKLNLSECPKFQASRQFFGGIGKRETHTAYSAHKNNDTEQEDSVANNEILATFRKGCTNKAKKKNLPFFSPLPYSFCDFRLMFQEVLR
jgi:hypothetical protein